MSILHNFARPLPLVLLALTVGLGCQPDEDERSVASTAQEVRAGAGEGGEVLLGVDLLVTDEDGKSVPCGEGVLDLVVEISRDGPDGPWVLVDAGSVEASCVQAGDGDLALVLDNSGSVLKDIEILQTGAQRVVNTITGAGGQVSLVRVSTDAEVQSELSSSTSQLQGTVDELFITNGWTALWDGVRMGNETLGAATSGQTETPTYADATSFCTAARKRGVVVFTDGADNNSAHQQLQNDSYPGDGMDTVLADLYGLRIGGATTPIYAVGLGDDVDDNALQSLADASGGRYLPVDDVEQVDDVLAMIAEYFSAAHRACTEIPSHLCGELYVRVSHSWTRGDQATSGVSTHRLDVPCDARANGRVATILLTMEVAEATADTLWTLEANTVNWVSPVDAPRVLFVLDDFHHGEHADDAQRLYAKLSEAGYDAAYLPEPSGGITPADVAGFDVVWFSNPGYPMDDALSFDTLLQHSQAGGGVVLQGDDMSWSHGGAFSTTPLSRLNHVDNGVSYCGVRIDNSAGGRYRIVLNEETHPMIAGVEGATFLYGDDIDTTTAVEATEVLAWADVDNETGCATKPVITGFTPTAE